MRRKLLLKESLVATIFIFLGLAIIIQITLSFHVFDPFYRAYNDFKFTDLVHSKLSQNTLDTNVIIVNIGKLDRNEISKLINNINQAKPSVLGVDALFTDLKDPLSDLALKQAFSSSNNIVLAAGITQVHNDHGHGEAYTEILKPHDVFGQHEYGMASLIAEDGTTIRHFHNSTEDNHHNIIPSFAAEIVKLHDADAYSFLQSRSKNKEVINYKGNLSSYIHLDHEDVFHSSADLSILENKIVLLGYLNETLEATPDLEDIFFTPVNPVFSGKSNPDMKGVVIHANIISMILDRNYINPFPSWLNWIIAFIVCFLHVVLFMYYYVENHKWFHPVAKVVQLITSILIVWVVFILYRNFNLEFDSKITIVAILLSVDLLYFYDGFIKWVARKFNYKSYIIEHH